MSEPRGSYSRPRGRQHFGWCRKGELCPGNHKRVRLTATKPGYCSASGQVEFQKLDIW